MSGATEGDLVYITQDASCNGAAENNISINSNLSFVTRQEAGVYYVCWAAANSSDFDPLDTTIRFVTLLLTVVSSISPSYICPTGSTQAEITVNGALEGEYIYLTKGDDCPSGVSGGYFTVGPTNTTTIDLSLLESGDYKVCWSSSVTDTSNINFKLQPASLDVISPLTVATTFTPASCYGVNDGSITANASVSTGAQYVWQPSNIAGVSDPTASDLPPGTYSVCVEVPTDFPECILRACSDAVVIPEPDAIQVADPIASSGCGSNSGTVTLTATSGAGPYTFYLSNDTYSINGTHQEKFEFQNLGSGIYTFYVQDFAGCMSQKSNVTVETAELLMATATSIINVTCTAGAEEGNITVLASGGTWPYTFSWTQYNIPIPSVESGNASTISNLKSGYYNVTVTDDNGCSYPLTDLFVDGPQETLQITTVEYINAKCHEDAVSVTVSVIGGSLPYEFKWYGPSGEVLSFDNATYSMVANLTTGEYNITVVDAKGCQDQRTINITRPEVPLSVVLVSSTHVLCNGGKTGNITAMAEGGLPPYLFIWSSYNGSIVGTSEGQNLSLSTADNLSSDYYNLTVTDSYGCRRDINNTFISQPQEKLSLSLVNVTHASCYGQVPGDITVRASGGNGTYAFYWLGPYDNITFTNDQNISIASNLTEGNYNVTVVDENGCKEIISNIQVLRLDVGLQIQITNQSGIKCFGGHDGFITVTVEGGVAPYNFTWISEGNVISSLEVDNSSTAANLTAGYYNLTVTDFNGCSKAMNDIPVTQPDQLLISLVNATYTGCHGENVGIITVSASGGTGAYTFYWSGSSENITFVNELNLSTASKLFEGNYSVTVIDENQCSRQRENISIFRTVEELSVKEMNTSHVRCFGGNDGSIIAMTYGGLTPYSYIWTSYDNAVNTSINDNGTSTAYNLTAGYYNLTVTDAAGCSAELRDILISQPQDLPTMQLVDYSPVKCYGGNDGSIMVTASGGIYPYFFSWTGPLTDITHDDMGNSSLALNLTAGTYGVTVQDENGCVSEIGNLVIGGPQEPLFASVANLTRVTCIGGEDGNITVLASGGTWPYTFNWTQYSSPILSSDSGNTSTISNLKSGYYNMTVTDDNGCSFTLSDIYVPDAEALQIFVLHNTNAMCVHDMGNITIGIHGGIGPFVFNWTGPDGAVYADNNDNTSVAVNLMVGVLYNVTVYDSNGCRAERDFLMIPKPEVPLSVNFTQTNVKCNGGNEGNITAIAQGGHFPYTFVWSSYGKVISVIQDQNTSTVTNLAAGYYNLSVTDRGNCMETIYDIYISQPDEKLSLDIISIMSSTCGRNDGSIAVIAYNGTGTHAFYWYGPTENITVETDQNKSTASYLVEGFYNVTVVDEAGCVAQYANIYVNKSSAELSVAVNTSDVLCNGGNDGSVTVMVEGGTDPYTYVWSSNGTIIGTTEGQNISMQANLTAGYYNLTVTDANGCSKDVYDIRISQPTDPLILELVKHADVSCHGIPTGQIEVRASGGTPPYSFEWPDHEPDVFHFDMDSSSIASNLTAGTYHAVVQDINGCVAHLTGLIIEEPQPINITIDSSTPNKCYGDSAGTIRAVVNGGTPSYLFAWSAGERVVSSIDGKDTSMAEKLPAGLYNFTVTDSLGCSQTMTNIVVPQPDELNLLVSSVKNVSRPDANDGEISIVPVGGTPPYYINWYFDWSQNSTTVTNLKAGEYSVRILDSNGCLIIRNISVIAIALSASASTSTTRSYVTPELEEMDRGILAFVIVFSVAGLIIASVVTFILWKRMRETDMPPPVRLRDMGDGHMYAHQPH